MAYGDNANEYTARYYCPLCGKKRYETKLKNGYCIIPPHPDYYACYDRMQIVSDQFARFAKTIKDPKAFNKLNRTLPEYEQRRIWDE